MAMVGAVTAVRAVKVRLLGPFEVAVEGRPVVIGSPKQRLLLAMLAVHGRCSVDVLAEELWDGRPPVSLGPTLQSLVSRLRRVFEDTASAEPAVAMESDGDGYRAVFASGVLDFRQFEELVERARRHLVEGNVEAAVAALWEGLGFWRGAALEGFSEREFARADAARLDGIRLDATEELAEAELRAGRPAGALAVVEKHLAAQPLRERAWGQRMLALYRLGRQAEALRAYQTVRSLLAEELGLDPTPALGQLEALILRHDPALDAVDAPPGAARVEDARGPAVMAAFLFTDIVASTRRWQGDHSAMGADLARHDGLIRDAVCAHGGTPFTHTGDGMAATFPSTSSAVVAAVAAQRALLSQDWTGAEPLRVRMAVHVGTAEHRAGTFLGPAVHRVARLLDLAAGGEILCSGPAADLARESLPSDVSLLDIGERPLADFGEPERVHQVLHPDLPVGLRTDTVRPGARHNLPGSPTSFVGRQGELAQLDDHLAETRLLTVTGVGGAGKTRLALEAARRVLGRFPDGVWLVDFVPVQDPALVPEAVTAALGLLAGEPSATDLLCGYLADRRVLLILDNCEHVLPGVRALVTAVLGRCPNSAVLATSREVLGVAGEMVWTAPALSLPRPTPTGAKDLAGSDAAALFTERAATSLPGFAVSDANAAAVARICHRLDGLPLALELAAARMRVLGAQQLADRLDDRFKTLGALPGGSDSRRRTLRATMEWSWALLALPERTALAQLSVFPASFDLDAAEAVAGGEETDALDVLARLVDTSLLVVDRHAAGVRYRLLETVRQFAAEQLERSGATSEARRRHLEHFVGRCEAWRRAGRLWHEGDWAVRSYRDRENYEAAFDWALASGEWATAGCIVAALWPAWVYSYEGRMAAAHDRIEQVCEAPDVPVPLAVEALFALAFARWERGGRVGADVIRALDEAIKRAESSGGFFERARALLFRGQVAVTAGDAPDGTCLLQQSRQLFEQVDDRASRLMIAWCEYELGWVTLTLGDLAQADVLFTSALDREALCGPEPLVRVHILAGAAVAAATVADAARAKARAVEAIATAQTIPFAGIQVMTLCRGAEAAVLSGNHTDFAVGELLRIVRELGGVRWVGRALALAALAMEDQGSPEAAAAALASARELGEASLTPPLARLLQQCRQRIADALGPDRLGRIETAAAARTPDQSLAHALDALRGE